MARLPQGNQKEFLQLIHREALTVHELEDVVGLMLSARSVEQQRFVLDYPREALSQMTGAEVEARDPRLSPVASQLWRKVSMLLGMLARMDGFLSSQGRAGLTPRDRELLAPRFERLCRDATSVATLSRDLISELART